MNKAIDLPGADLQKKVDLLLDQQTKEWDLASKNYRGLEKVRKRAFKINDRVNIGVQFNPERMTSSAAKVDPKSISERKCFLCAKNLPEQQKWVPFGEEYLILVNPFPIFPRHLTIPHREHIDQRIKGRFGEMLALASELKDFVVFYNGPQCGASAPDHFHFQAGNKGFMPVEKDFENMSRVTVKGKENCRVSIFKDYLRHCIILDGSSKTILTDWFEKAYMGMEEQMTAENPEPMMNILVSWEKGRWKVFIFPRKKHRPWQFFEEGEKQILLSPASVDLGGMLITPREEDFEKLGVSDIVDIFGQITWKDEDFEKLTHLFKT